MDLDLRDTPETDPRTLALARGAVALGIALSHQPVSYTHLTLPTTILV